VREAAPAGRVVAARFRGTTARADGGLRRGARPSDARRTPFQRVIDKTLLSAESRCKQRRTFVSVAYEFI